MSDSENEFLSDTKLFVARNDVSHDSMKN